MAARPADPVSVGVAGNWTGFAIFVRAREVEAMVGGRGAWGDETGGCAVVAGTEV